MREHLLENSHVCVKNYFFIYYGDLEANIGIYICRKNEAAFLMTLAETCKQLQVTKRDMKYLRMI